MKRRHELWVKSRLHAPASDDGPTLATVMRSGNDLWPLISRAFGWQLGMPEGLSEDEEDLVDSALQAITDGCDISTDVELQGLRSVREAKRSMTARATTRWPAQASCCWLGSGKSRGEAARSPVRSWCWKSCGQRTWSRCGCRRRSKARAPTGDSRRILRRLCRSWLRSPARAAQHVERPAVKARAHQSGEPKRARASSSPSCRRSRTASGPPATAVVSPPPHPFLLGKRFSGMVVAVPVALRLGSQGPLAALACEEIPHTFVQGKTYSVVQSSIETTGMNSANELASRVSSYSRSRRM